MATKKRVGSIFPSGLMAEGGGKGQMEWRGQERGVCSSKQSPRVRLREKRKDCRG